MRCIELSMKSKWKIICKAGTVILFTAIFSSLSAQIQIGDAAPDFAAFQENNTIFNSDSVYGKKVVTFIFGSIT